MVLVMRSMSRDDGAVAVFTALLAVVLFGMAALVVDLGLARDNRRQAQNTADAAALAAANALYATTPINLNAPGDISAAVDAAKVYAAKNYGTTASEWSGCSTDEPLGYVPPEAGTNCISFDQETYPKNALVVLPVRQSGVFFGGILGSAGTTIGALAQARLSPGGVPVCVFCVIKETDHNIQQGNLIVEGGNIWINGDLTVGNNGTVYSEFSDVTNSGGKTFVSGEVSNSSSVQNGEARTRSPRIVDPLAGTVLPFATQGSLVRHTDPCADGPGLYGDVSIGDCTLDPGLYVFTDGLRLSGNESFDSNGATFYFTCGDDGVPRACNSPGELGAGMLVTGNGDLTFTAPTADENPTVPEELYGFAVVYDRYNTAKIEFRGNGAFNFQGTLYAVNATMDNRGNGCTTDSTAMVVIGSVEFSGNNACFSTTFDAEKNAPPTDSDRGLVR